MQKIKLMNVENSELSVLKAELCNFYNHKEATLRNIDIHDIDKLLSEMFQIDSSKNLYYNFGTKIVSNFKNKKGFFKNITITVTEAVILIYACSFQNSLRNEFEQYVTGKYIGKIHEQLINQI